MEEFIQCTTAILPIEKMKAQVQAATPVSKLQIVNLGQYSMSIIIYKATLTFKN